MICLFDFERAVGPLGKSLGCLSRCEELGLMDTVDVTAEMISCSLYEGRSDSFMERRVSVVYLLYHRCYLSYHTITFLSYDSK